MLTNKKRILIGIPTVLICAAILIGAWHFLPEKYFIIFLICFAVIVLILERFVVSYEKRKNES
jgi:uncharacterized membrane protein YhfC